MRGCQSLQQAVAAGLAVGFSGALRTVGVGGPGDGVVGEARTSRQGRGGVIVWLVVSTDVCRDVTGAPGLGQMVAALQGLAAEQEPDFGVIQKVIYLA